MNSAVSNENWWSQFYNETPFELFLERTDHKHLHATLSFLWDKLELEVGHSVLDQCCGTGSLSIPLAQRGISIYGVDACDRFIHIARSLAAQEGLNCTFEYADAFEFVAARPCDAAFNWWTSFGYSQDDKINLLMLRRAFESLKNGGWFCLDTPNPSTLFYEKQKSETYNYSTAAGDIVINRGTTYDCVRYRRLQLWTFQLPDGRKLTYHTSLRLYSLEELTKMLVSIGFTNIEFYGSVNGELLVADSPRSICRCRRPR